MRAVMMWMLVMGLVAFPVMAQEEKEEAVESKPVKAAAKKPAPKPEKKEAEKKEAEKASSGEATAYDCPTRLELSEQKVLKKTPTGFSSMIDAKNSYWLTGVAIYRGKKDPMVLEPARSTEVSSDWVLQDNGKESYAMVCRYGDTTLRLAKTLDKAFKQCSLTPGENPAEPKGTPIMIKLSCF